MTDATLAQKSSSPNPNAATSAAGLVSKLRTSPMIPLLIAGAAAIAILVALLMWARTPDYRVLYSNLSDADGGRIIGELDTRGIPYRFSDGGGALLVPGDQVHALRLQLAEQGLPQGGNVGFELMDTQAFGVSQFTERLNYQRGLEGELARSMEALGPVSQARIHLAMAKPSVFVRDSKPAKASVVLTLQPGRVLGDGQINAIVHMVSSSVPELSSEAVTVVDQDGRLLSRSGSGLGDLDGTQLSYIQEVERSYQQRIEHILSPILGPENVRAQVAAQIDFSSREATAERYNPNQGSNESAIRSRQTSESYTGGDAQGRGIPGALTNTPPGNPESPIDEGTETDEQGKVDQSRKSPSSRLDRDDVVNYEVDRSVEHVQYRRGNIERLSVAVVVNYRDGTDDRGQAVREPLSDDELAQIERLVRQAMGFSEARGDAIEVVNSSFIQRDDSVEPLPWWQTRQAIDLAMTLGRYLLVILAALFLWFMMVRPLVKRHSQARPMMPAAAGPRAVTAAQADDGFEEEAPPPRRRRRGASAYEHNLKAARDMAQEDPRMVALVVKGWIKEHD
ncbi:flagellar M-ring protein FliF [Modicisalibacter ilicicola DSM 19980]|uniref:Flagellar M-ring protein n=1 Tax=Modicisalibacter ilicicola DSM 19980 TaxID=1121942 RepID=A0A1M4YZC7_9GAMM|nr:flagellar basal-body MS-ring/collar protein FliF [Halomonas ilicicola]SHF10862.1 flagellar M-ring protein FliF [Halomonas ilicicola DSM 19980]